SVLSMKRATSHQYQPPAMPPSKRIAATPYPNVLFMTSLSPPTSRPWCPRPLVAALHGLVASVWARPAIPVKVEWRWPRPRKVRSVALALRRQAAIGVAGIDAENVDLARKEAQLLERQIERPVLGMTLDIGIELRRGEAAAHHVALELRHVDAVGGEAAQCLVKRRRHVPHAKHEGGDDEAAPLRYRLRLARHDEKARRVVLGVLDVFLKRDEAVDLAGELGRDGGFGGIAALRHLGGGARRVDR